MGRQGIEEKGLEMGQYEYIVMTEPEGKVSTYHNQQYLYHSIVTFCRQLVYKRKSQQT